MLKLGDWVCRRHFNPPTCSICYGVVVGKNCACAAGRWVHLAFRQMTVIAFTLYFSQPHLVVRFGHDCNITGTALHHLAVFLAPGAAAGHFAPGGTANTLSSYFMLRAHC